jgi:dipeptidyl aminopeptidase/acylaminoacyl peptidase
VAGTAIERVRRPSSSSLEFAAKTWDDQWITNARFAPDGETIVFSAAPSGNVPRLFVVRPGALTAQPVGDPATQLLSISSTGELAVLTSARPAAAGHRVFLGTLARMPMDGAPRPWLEGISEADWSPDGTTMAIIRWQDGGIQLEYPIGQVLVRRTSGYLSDLRVSPDGNRVAFFDHQLLGDNRGWVKVVDRNGSVNTLAGEYWGEEGLAWAPDGRSVFFTAGNDGGNLQPLIVNAMGTPIVRQAVPTAGWMYVLDVARDGRLLTMRNDLRYSIRALLPGEPRNASSPGSTLLRLGTCRATGSSSCSATRVRAPGRTTPSPCAI